MTTIIIEKNRILTDAAVTDGRGLVAHTGNKVLVRKRGRDAVVAAWAGPTCGSGTLLVLARQVLSGSRIPPSCPELDTLENEFEAVILSTVQPPVHVLNKRAAPFLYELPYCFGSGDLFARAALLAGADAMKAMDVAAQIDPATRPPVFETKLPPNITWEGDDAL